MHYRTLQIVYDVYNESYENLLNKVTIFDTSKTLVILGCKVNPGFICNIFQKKHTPLTIYDEETYYTFHLLIILAMMLILQFFVRVYEGITFHPRKKESRTLYAFKNEVKNFKIYSLQLHCLSVTYVQMPFYFNCKFLLCFYDCGSLTGSWYLLAYSYFFNQSKINILL